MAPGPAHVRTIAGWSLALLLVTLAGCTSFGLGKSEEPPVEPNVFPADYKPALLKFLQTYLADPTQIHDAYIAEPALKPFGSENRYVVCVRYNARDGTGKYLGSQDKAGTYYGGKMNQFVDATRELCGAAAYQPFPELQTLTRVGGGR
jgi:hypothetical protein